MSIPPLFGLVLAGGASTRMRQDKAALQYHGRSQLEWAYELLAPFCTATFVSVRPDQREEPTRAAFPQIVDRQPGIGPLAGISAALQTHPKVAWLVLACDLPFLTESALRKLVEERDPASIATAYRSSHDGLPEPLCAIWEPAAREAVSAYIQAGKHCPRKLLIASQCKLIDLAEPKALDNINTIDELQAAKSELASNSGGGPAAIEDSEKPKTIRIQYFAILREQAGRSEETIDTPARTAAELFEQVRARHRFQLSPAQLKVAVNSEFADWQTQLAHGDTVVFIPPVAGG